MKWTTEKLNTFFAMKDQGYTLKEIATELGCTYPAVQSKSHEIKSQKKESTKMENSEKKIEHTDAVGGAKTYDEAKAIITDNSEDGFVTAARLWGAYTGCEFSPVDVAMMMVLLKIARIKAGGGTADGFAELAEYAVCAAKIISARPTASVQSAGDAENEETSKCSDKINDAQRVE